MLSVKNLNVFYGGIHALKGVTIDVQEGQIVSIIGSNGAGKSTLINAISGIVKYKDGEILYKGEKLPKHAHKIVKSGICQVPEGRVIFANLTVMENLSMGAFLRNDKEGIEKDLENIFTLFPKKKEKTRLQEPNQEESSRCLPWAGALCQALSLYSLMNLL